MIIYAQKEHCEGFQCSGNRTSYRPEYAGRNSALDPGARQYFAIIVVKQLFGGLGQNFMNPALAARCFLMISFAGKMTDFSVSDSFKGAVDGVTGATPLAALRDHGFVAGSSVPVKNLILVISREPLERHL